MDEVTAEALDAVAQVRGGVQRLLATSLDALTSVQVVELLQALESVRRTLAAVDVRVLAEAEVRHVAGDYARTSTVDLLVSGMRVSPGEARARVMASVDLGSRQSVTGQRLEPLHPRVAAAQAEGMISPEHARVITGCIAQIPAEAGPTAAEVAESMLVEAAHHQDPRALAQTARLLLLRLDPDGREPREQLAQRRREFSLMPRPDGMLAARGTLTAPAGEALATVLDALSAPQPEPDGTPDPARPGSAGTTHSRKCACGCCAPGPCPTAAALR